MAYTKIIVIHNRLDRCLNYTQDEEKTSLETVLDYAMNRDKTEQDCFETALNCDRETAYADMMDTKRRWGKASRKRKGYHVIQSFAPGEVTPEQAHAIGVELAQRLLADKYEVVVSTHLNKAHLHSHIVFNSVSFVDGSMYRDRISDLLGGSGVGIRGTSDAICLEHGLSIIEPSEPSASRAEWEAEKAGKPNFRGLARADIDTAIANAYTMRSFWVELVKMGYQVKRYPQVPHAAIKPPGAVRFLQLDKLGGRVQRGGDILPPYGEPHRHSAAAQQPCPHSATAVFPLWAALPCERPFALKGRPHTGLPASVSEIPLFAEKDAIPAQGPSLTGRNHQV